MNILNKKPVAALIMSLVILASLILIAQTPAVEALIVCGILLVVCILVDLVAGAKALTKMQSRLAAIAIGGTAIVGIVIFGVATGLAMPDPDVASSPSPSASQDMEPPTSTTPETTEGDEKPTDEMYELGLFYYEREEYEKAIQTLDKVKDTSDFYADAMKLRAEVADGYRNSLTDTAKTYVDKGDYKLAIDILNAGLQVIPEDTKLAQTIETYSLEYTNAVRTAAITEAETFAAAQDYANALTTIQGAIDEVGSDAELEALLLRYTDQYKDYALVQAGSIFNNEGYEAAVQFLREVQKLIVSDSELSAAIAEYESHKPVSLDTLEIWQHGTFTCGPYTHETVTDNYGNTYDSFYTGSSGGWGGGSWENYNVYKIDGEYSVFSGTFCMKKQYNSYDTKSYLYVYGDDALLDKLEITGGDAPLEFSINISGVSLLKIQPESGGGYGGEEISFAANLFLTK